MRLLILGGTRFIGYHLVQAAQARGHYVTLFNRGRHDPTPLPGVEHLHGDRDTDLSALQDSIDAGVKWDAVIDTSGYVPRAVQATATLLRGVTERYVFISSASVYADFDASSIPEDHPLGQMTDEQVAEMEQLTPNSTGSIAPFYGELYGPLKARCEQILEEVMPGRVLVIRPGLVVGPQDYSDRFTSWVRRLAYGGQVLAPGPASQPVHRCPGPRRVDDHDDRTAGDGDLQCHRASHTVDDRRIADDVPASRGERRAVAMGRRRVPDEAGHPTGQ